MLFIPPFMVLPIQDLPVDFHTSQLVKSAEVAQFTVATLGLIEGSRLLRQSHGVPGDAQHVFLVMVWRVGLRPRAIYLVSQQRKVGPDHAFTE